MPTLWLLPEPPKPLKPDRTKRPWRSRNFSGKKIKSTADTHREPDTSRLFFETSQHDFLKRGTIVTENDVIRDRKIPTGVLKKYGTAPYFATLRSGYVSSNTFFIAS